MNLCDELDLADTTFAYFDIVVLATFGGVGTNLRMQGAHLLDGSVVVVTPVDKRLHQPIQRGNVLHAAGNGARLQPGVAFPRPCVLNEIAFKRRERRDQRPTIAERAQPHIDAKHLAVFIDLV